MVWGCTGVIDPDVGGHVPVNISVFKLVCARVRARVCLREVNTLQPAGV